MKPEIVGPPQPYMPSNGTEGYSFIESWCTHCARDRASNGQFDWSSGAEPDESDYCPILNASFRGEAREWIYRDGRPVCTAFVDVGNPIVDRCQHTPDMFEEK